MTSLFLATSAIYTSYGKCLKEERIKKQRDLQINHLDCRDKYSKIHKFEVNYD